jgi:ParB-like chromosome segregation protein Spo0J
MKTEFFENYPLEKLILYERNPRKISAKAVEVVAKSIRMNGKLDPIEIDDDGIILAGHTRYKAYKELGEKNVPVIQHIGLTKVQKRTYRIASNKTAEYSEWDDELLAAELKDIDMETQRIIDSTGIEDIISDIVPDNNKEIDEAAMLNTENECPKCGFKW